MGKHIVGLYANEYWLNQHYPNYESELTPDSNEPTHEVQLAPGFWKVVHEGDEWREQRIKEINEEYNKALYSHIDGVRSPRETNWGPRGDYYEWCHLKEDGTLDFGDEEGNYAGGHTITPISCSPEEYWAAVKRKLQFLKVNNPQFYQDIMDMLKRHNVTLPI